MMRPSTLLALVSAAVLATPLVGRAQLAPPYVESCFGDGGFQPGCTDCPCGNTAPFPAGGGCLNSTGASARLVATGSASLSIGPYSTQDLGFELELAPPGALCLLISGGALAPNSPANPCFGTAGGIRIPTLAGLRCVVTDVDRHGGRLSDANGVVGQAFESPPWGAWSLPAPGLGVAAAYVPGQARHFQAIYRDLPHGTCGVTLNSTQAISVVFAP